MHSIGYFGNVDNLPSEDELSVITQCGHGLIAFKRVRKMVEEIKLNRMTVDEAAEFIARPCVCGIVNPERVAMQMI